MTKSFTPISTTAFCKFVLDNMAEGIIVVDDNGTIIYTNSSFERMVAYGAETLISQNIGILYPTLAHGKSGFYSHILPELQKTGVWQGDITTIKRDGQHLGISAHFCPYEDGSHNYWIGFHRSIIELENIKLGSQQVPIKKLLDVMPDTFEIFDPHTMTYLLWNQAANNFSGEVDEAIAVKNPSDDFLDPAELPRVNTAIEQAMVGDPVTVKTTVIHKDGTRIPLEYTIAAIRDSVGYPLYLVAVGRDIREQLKTEEALRQSEGKYRDLVEKISDVIYSADTNGVITYVNPAVEKLLGYSPENIIGTPIARFIYDEDLEKLRSNIRNLLSDVSYATPEYRVLTATKEIRWIRVTSQPILQDGHVIGLQGVLTDITEQKNFEEQREQVVMVAERDRLARRLHDAVTQTLFSASVMAESTPRILDNNPELAKRNLTQLSIMLRGALAEMRTMLIELRPAALAGKPLGDLLQTLAQANQGKINSVMNVTIENDTILPEEVTIVFYRIAQEAFNNIVKYAEADEVNVYFESRNSDVTMIIKDNGRGFEQENIPPGHYGLKIMAERIDQVGGKLAIKSKPGQGTKVIVNWSEQITNEGYK